MGNHPFNEPATLVSLHQRIQAAGPTDRSLGPLLKDYAPLLLKALGRDHCRMHDELTLVGVPGLPNGYCQVNFYASPDGEAVCFADSVQDDEGEDLEMDESLSDLDLLTGDTLARNPELHSWLQEIAHLRTHALHHQKSRISLAGLDPRGIWEIIEPARARVAIEALAGSIYADLAAQADRMVAAKQPFARYEWKDGRLVTHPRSQTRQAWLEREHRAVFHAAVATEGKSKALKVPSLDKAQLIADRATEIRQGLAPPVIPTYVFREWPGMTQMGALAHYLVEAENGPRLTRRAAAECLGIDPESNSIRDHLRRAREVRQEAHESAIRRLPKGNRRKGAA